MRLIRWRDAPRILAELAYPRCCPGCGESERLAAGEDALCAVCASGLTPIRPPFCETCGETFAGGGDGRRFRCSNCAGRKFGFAFAIAAFENSGTARDLIHRFKYGRMLYLRGCLATLLASALDDPRIREGGGGRGWILVPVPLHPLRMVTRGFNQADELARLLAARTGLRRASALRRVRWTSSQAKLGRERRLANLGRAMVVRRPGLLAGEHVLLVDDVFTTGATTSACARALTEDGGAEKVAVITLARG